MTLPPIRAVILELGTSPLLRLRLERAILAAAALVFLFPAAASAHALEGSVQGLLHGFAHPFLGWDHLLAMVAVGLWAAQHGTRRAWVLPAVFVGVMIFGGGIGMAALPLPGVEAGILASVLVLGLLIALAARVPLVASAAVVGSFALFHGHAHGAEMPAAISGLTYGVGLVAATALLHAGGIALAFGLRHLPRAEPGPSRERPFAQPGLRWIRAAGVAICAGGLLQWML